MQTNLAVWQAVIYHCGSCHMHNFCCNKSFVAKNMCLSWQTHVCHDKNMLVMTNMFVVTDMCLLWQYVCRNEHNFVATSNEHNFVTTNIILLQQAYFCHEKRHVLSWQTRVCRDKTFVATKIILVAAPANDSHRVAENVLSADTLLWEPFCAAFDYTVHCLPLDADKTMVNLDDQNMQHLLRHCHADSDLWWVKSSNYAQEIMTRDCLNYESTEHP